MRKGLILGLLGVLALALLAAGTASVGADTTPPNDDHLYPYWNALQQGLISGTAITACSDGDYCSPTGSDNCLKPKTNDLAKWSRRFEW